MTAGRGGIRRYPVSAPLSPLVHSVIAYQTTFRKPSSSRGGEGRGGEGKGIEVIALERLRHVTF